MAWRPDQKMVLIKATEGVGSTHSNNFQVKVPGMLLGHTPPSAVCLFFCWRRLGLPSGEFQPSPQTSPGGLFGPLRFCEPQIL